MPQEEFKALTTSTKKASEEEADVPQRGCLAQTSQKQLCWRHWWLIISEGAEKPLEEVEGKFHFNLRALSSKPSPSSATQKHLDIH